MALSEQQRKANLRLALILASVAAAFALGFFVKIAWFGG
ncbi:MAG: cytochrome oxidase small assembly protein [Rubrivivax sp.]|nr:cytochrome oxidase small assembly protein [Rubrivivax sp.]